MKLFKSSSLFKRSFTLVELSTVLLVLSVLTGTLLVGRKIVDRANIQRVIFEIDKYKTEFYQFQDTYGVLPGNVDEETCMRNTEFYSAQTRNERANGKEIVVGKYCSGVNGRAIEGYNTLKIMATAYHWKSFFNAMRFMKISGLIDNVNTDITSYEINPTITVSEDGTQKENGENFTPAENKLGPKDVIESKYISHQTVKMTQAFTSFDREGVITYAGITFDAASMGTDGSDRKRYANFIRGATGSGEYEFENLAVANIINDKNFIVFYRNVASIADTTNGSSGLSTGLLNANIMSALDSKIDTGRPGSGKIIALKNGFAHQQNATDDIQKKVCYNTTAKNIDAAYYVNDKDAKNGCNFIYILQ